MLDRQKGGIVIECDGCSTVLETETADIEAARNRMKREGWMAANPRREKRTSGLG